MIGLPSIVGRMSQWAGWQEFGMHGSYYLSYWKINLSGLWSLEIPSAIFAFNGVLPKHLSLQHITWAFLALSIRKWHITPERQSYYSLYSAINTLASHFTSYGAILKIQQKHMSTIEHQPWCSNKGPCQIKMTSWWIFWCDSWRPEVSLSQQEEAKILRALPASGHWVALNDSIASVLVGERLETKMLAHKLFYDHIDPCTSV